MLESQMDTSLYRVEVRYRGFEKAKFEMKGNLEK